MGGLGTVVTLWSPPALGSSGPVESLAQPRQCRPETPCLAVVIDDVGRDLARLDRLLRLRLDLTFSVLPHARHTAKSLDAIRARGRQIMVHLPMAPLDPKNITDEPVVIGRDGPTATALLACLEAVPDAVGANNHMGSATSRDPALALALMQLLGRRGLWFLDSRTVSGSVLCSQALEAGVPCLQRDVFLDDSPSPSLAARQLEQAIELARKRGWAVAIAHPRAVTVALLGRLEQSTLSSRITVRRLSEVVADGT